MALPHIPVLRFGKAYTSLETAEVRDHRTGEALVSVSQVNAGIIRRDARRAVAAHEALRRVPCRQLLDVCAKAAELYVNETLPLGDDGSTQSPRDYVEQLSATSGLPHTLVRSNMDKVRYVLANMERILAGLTRGLDVSVIDAGVGEQAGVPVSYFPTTEALGVVLPSNSPGVNSIWMPAVALKVPVMLKPGREEPWTPLRIIRALIAAGGPAEAFGFYPTDHEGAAEILHHCGRGIIFGDDKTMAKYRDNPAIECHGTGRSKVIIGEDRADHWREHLDVLVDSVAANGGRSCINASTIVTPRHGRELAEALADRLAAIEPTPADDDDARLAAFANPAFAEAIDAMIDEGLATPGAEDLTAAKRSGPRRVELAGSTYLRPTVVRCGSFDHPLANTEFLFPFVAVVELPQAEVLDRIGPSLVVTAITEDETFVDRLIACPEIDRLNLGPTPTSRVQWDQPHEGNLFEFLYRRRAIQRASA